jgi:3-hydroxyisobutyrate dehydrogenase
MCATSGAHGSARNERIMALPMRSCQVGERTYRKAGKSWSGRMAKVAFLGLGVMGYPMAGHLKNKGGHDVTVYNRTAAKAEKWVSQFGGRRAVTPREAAAGQDVVIACVGNDNDLREVTLGSDGSFTGMKKGAIFIDHTTASAEIARELYTWAKEHGFDFVDAPVSGGQAGAENGVLTVMCGGDTAPYAQAEKVIAAYARMCKLLGGPGAGQLTKMVNQICIAGLVQGLAEGIHFAKKAGLDVEAVIETISKGAAQSWQMENRYKTMNAGKFDFGFAVDWMRKDLAICIAEARRSGANLPVAALVDQFYSEVQKMGGRRWDTSSLIARLER